MKMKLILLHIFIAVCISMCGLVYADDEPELNLENLALKAYSKVNSLQSTSVINKQQRYELLVADVINKYPKTEAALISRLEVSEHNYRQKYVTSVPMTIWNQGLYRIQKEFLEYHPKSIRLLMQLAKLSFYAYPEECVKYSLDVISIDPNNGRAYYTCGRSYQLLGKYKKALSILNKGKTLLVKRLVSELRKNRPYWDDDNDTPIYYAKTINHAKSYFRKLGYNVGKDVDYDLTEIRKSKSSEGKQFAYPSTLPYKLIDNSHTTIYDLWVLDYTLYHINQINSGKPVYTPYDRVSVTEVPLRSTKSIELLDK